MCPLLSKSEEGARLASINRSDGAKMNILEIALVNAIRARPEERRNLGLEEAYWMRVFLRSVLAIGVFTVFLALL